MGVLVVLQVHVVVDGVTDTEEDEDGGQDGDTEERWEGVDRISPREREEDEKKQRKRKRKGFWAMCQCYSLVSPCFALSIFTMPGGYPAHHGTWVSNWHDDTISISDIDPLPTCACRDSSAAHLIL